ncbi:hypothetical protein LCGC14_0941630 [marine sediment metagenome]|uniref:Uncharacterized protein n=1 Tax=marine sediment metagenome TaxID=412755 RepID=A0A0F9P609_9ZZZZ
MLKKKTIGQRWSAMKRTYRIFRTEKPDADQYGRAQSAVTAIGVFFSLDDNIERQIERLDPWRKDV